MFVSSNVNLEAEASLGAIAQPEEVCTIIGE